MAENRGFGGGVPKGVYLGQPRVSPGFEARSNSRLSLTNGHALRENRRWLSATNGPEQLAASAAQRIATYSITSSARASNNGGIVRPSAFAVFTLITRSNLVGCWTGSSPAFSPVRILATYPAAAR